MISNKFKEKLVIIGGTIGISTISIAITLVVYNVQLPKGDTPKIENKENIEIVYNNELSKEQREVAENLLEKLNKIELNNKKTNDGYSEETDNNLIKVEENAEEIISPKDAISFFNNTEEEVIETVSKNNNLVSFIKPMDGSIGMIFSEDTLVYSKTLNEWLSHKGVDILANEGTNVKVSCDGKIKEMYSDERYGFTIVVEHVDGYMTKYSGICEEDSLSIGMLLKQGDIISKLSKPVGFEVGEGCHLHFELIKDGINIKPEFI